MGEGCGCEGCGRVRMDYLVPVELLKKLVKPMLRARHLPVLERGFDLVLREVARPARASRAHSSGQC